MSELEYLETQKEKLEGEILAVESIWPGILKIILIGTITPFIFPFLPMRKIDMSTKENYPNAVMIIGVVSIILSPVAIYMHVQKINYEKYSLEFDLEQIKKKISILSKTNATPLQ